MSEFVTAPDRLFAYLVYAMPAIFGVAALIYGRVMLLQLRRAKARQAKSAHAPIRRPDMLISKNDVLSAVNSLERRSYPHAAE
jgi:hypothetical protein